jgi:hypothetical protein
MPAPSGPVLPALPFALAAGRRALSPSCRSLVLPALPLALASPAQSCPPSPAQSCPPSLLRSPLAVVRRPAAASPRSRLLRATHSHSGPLGPAAPSSDRLFLHTIGSPTPPLPGHAALLFNHAYPLLPFLGPRGLPPLASSSPGCSGTAIPAFSPPLLPSGGCQSSAQAGLPLFFLTPPGAFSSPPSFTLHPTSIPDSSPPSISYPFLDFPRSIQFVAASPLSSQSSYPESGLAPPGTVPAAK